MTIAARALDFAGRARQRPVVLAVVALVSIPALFFGGAYLFGGHLLLNTDNLLQSYPLRVLVGQDLRHGVFPGWDPYIWSGTPLMAGLNAGAFYPTTLLFAIFPPHAAWMLGEIFIFAVTATGAFALFRAGGASAAASFIAAFSFTFAGAIATQASVHTDMAEGLVSLPWALFAVRRIADDGRWRWAGLFALAGATSVLAGSPEALLTVAIASVVYGFARWTVDRGSWRRLITRLAAGSAVAAGSTAFLWIPALRFIASSNRHRLTPKQAKSNHLDPWSALLGVIPYLEGGYRFFTQGAYFGPSNPSELGFYVGMLPLIAVLALCVPSWRSWLPKGERRPWYALILVGGVAATAAGTPLEHLLYHVPLYGNEYDTGRYVIEADLGACALLAWWIDGGLRPEAARPRFEVASAVLPFGLVVAIGIWFALDPVALWSHLGTAVTPPARPEGIGLALVMAAVLALSAASLALARHRLGRRHFVQAAAALVVVDVALFAGGSLYISGQNPPGPSTPGRVMALVKANLSPAGRYAVFDPDTFDPTGLLNAGEADTGALVPISSASGYESISDAYYARVTGTKVRSDMRLGFLSPSEYEPVGLQVLVTVPESFLVPLQRGTDAPVPVTVDPGDDPALPAGNVVGPDLPLFTLASPRAAMTVGTTDTWWFGRPLAVSRASLLLGVPSQRQVVQVGVMGRDGLPQWSRPRELPAGKTDVSLPVGGAKGDGLAIRLVAGADLGPIQPEVVDGRFAHMLAGPLSDSVTARNWQEIGTVGDFVLYRARYTPRQAWLEPLSIAGLLSAPTPSLDKQGSGLTDLARVTHTSEDYATISVLASAPSLLVWSTAYDAGWHVTVSRPGAPDYSIPVERVGLVMGVAVPSGLSTVSFSYEPPGLETGVAVSAATLGLVLLVVGAAQFVARGRKRGPKDGRE